MDKEQAFKLAEEIVGSGLGFKIDGFLVDTDGRYQVVAFAERAGAFRGVRAEIDSPEAWTRITEGIEATQEWLEQHEVPVPPVPHVALGGRRRSLGYEPR